MKKSKMIHRFPVVILCAALTLITVVSCCQMGSTVISNKSFVLEDEQDKSDDSAKSTDDEFEIKYEQAEMSDATELTVDKVTKNKSGLICFEITTEPYASITVIHKESVEKANANSEGKIKFCCLFFADDEYEITAKSEEKSQSRVCRIKY